MKAVPSEFLPIELPGQRLEFIVDNIGYTQIRTSDVHENDFKTAYLLFIN